MDTMLLMELFRSDGFWAVPKVTVRFFNSFSTAAVFSEVMEQNHMAVVSKQTIDDWFPLTYATIATRMCMPINKITTCMQEFVNLGILSSKRIGIPSKAYYMLNKEKFIALITAENNDASASSFDRASDRNNDSVIKETETEKEKEPASNEAEVTTDVVTPKPKLVRRVPTKIKSEPPPLFAHPDIARCFHHWNELSYPLQKHKCDPGLKIFQDSCMFIARALKKHSWETITQAMTDYKKILMQPNTSLSLQGAGHKVSLPEFFKYSKHTEERMLRSHDPLTIDNWFDECLKGYEHLNLTFSKYEPDYNPKVTEAIQSTYIELVARRTFSASDINCFIRSARFMIEYHSKHKEKINWNSCLMERNSPAMFAKRLVKAIIEDAQDVNMIEPTWLCSARTINSRLPKYLMKHGLLAPDVQKAKAVKKGYDPGYGKGEIH